MPKVFVDESYDQQKIFLMCAWMARAEEWELFSDAWDRELRADKPIEYFKNHEAAILDEQFRGWKEAERDAKVLALAKIIAKYELTGFIGGIHLPNFNSIFAGSIVPKKVLRSIVTFTEPYHWGCQCIISGVLGYQDLVAKNHSEQVDFVFDNGVKALDDCIANYPKLLAVLPPTAQAIAGTVIPGDDKKIAALQAADLLAGQMLQEIREGGVRHAPVEVMRKSREINYFKCLDRKPDLKNLSLINVVWATKHLEKIKKRSGEKSENKRKRKK
jgi:Protein of unknown function (DUF3800)